MDIKSCISFSFFIAHRFPNYCSPFKFHVHTDLNLLKELKVDVKRMTYKYLYRRIHKRGRGRREPTLI